MAVSTQAIQGLLRWALEHGLELDRPLCRAWSFSYIQVWFWLAVSLRGYHIYKSVSFEGTEAPAKELK